MRLSLPRLLLPLLAAALAAALAPVRAQDAPPPPVIPEGLGVNIHFTDPAPGEMERFAEAGFKWVRMDFFWAGIEREPGKYDFSAYDRLLGHLDKVGARAYLILDYGHPRYDGGLSPHSPEGRAAFARFAGAAAAHFQGRGVIWEIWNEPNISFWKPRPNVEDYAKLALETAEAIRAADPKAYVVAPASSGFPWEFLDALFASGVLEQIDAVSVHPYRESHPETAAEDYGRLRALIARHAPARATMPILSGEWGYSTAEKRFSEAEQARYLVREYLSNLANGVNLSIFYDWKDDGPDPKENEHRFGTVRQDLTPKPSFLAAKQLIDALRGYSYRHRLRGASPADWKLLFQNSGQEDSPLAIVSWTTDADADESARTPSIRLVKGSDPDAADLRTLASIQIPAGPLVETTGSPVEFHAWMPTSLGDRAVEFRIPGVAESLSKMSTFNGASRMDLIRLPASPLRAPHREIPLEIRHKARPLPAIVPLQVWRVDPLSLAIAPRGDVLEATIANPSKRAFEGRLVAKRPDGRETATAVASIPTGESEGRARLAVKASDADVDLVLVDAHGAPVVEPVSGRFEPIMGPDRTDLLDSLDAVLHVENTPAPGKASKPSRVATEGQSERAIKIAYEFDPGWRYLTVQPRKTLPIPEKAREALFWVKGDGSNAYLRCRFRDASGQTFQPDLGRLDFEGWRIVRIPLDGSAPGGAGEARGTGSPTRR
ncbi:cellulase family glycosylhydrolase [Planctomyces sp. SH-PL62]|uniref:cellulase family glycosylhydrolase n=1 Tax=Planctomyces sp. SH-PL62 TaxID=1636152 RepID=UPI00078EA9E2|nr:cellulase family glycosylhydrolase [Planctomyces sp. SH-PL62]AMV36280.1 Beta-xylosidase [Planctomyces sp. SH-PL62]